MVAIFCPVRSRVSSASTAQDPVKRRSPSGSERGSPRRGAIAGGWEVAAGQPLGQHGGILPGVVGGLGKLERCKPARRWLSGSTNAKARPLASQETTVAR